MRKHSGLTMIDLRTLLFLGLCLSPAALAVAAATESALTVTPVGSSLEIPATLIKPDGSGPFPYRHHA